MLQILGTLHFGEQLFAAVCNAKHTHDLLGAIDQVKGIVQMEGRSIYRIQGCELEEKEILNRLNSKNQRVTLTILIVLIHYQQ